MPGTIMWWLVRPKHFLAWFACANDEVVVIMTYNKIAWITIYVIVIIYLFSALIVSSGCYQLIVVGYPTWQ
jgi:hypothetical protein